MKLPKYIESIVKREIAKALSIFADKLHQQAALENYPYAKIALLKTKGAVLQTSTYLYEEAQGCLDDTSKRLLGEKVKPQEEELPILTSIPRETKEQQAKP